MGFPRPSRPVTITLVGAGLSLFLIGALATYFRRRRKPRPVSSKQPTVATTSQVSSERRWRRKTPGQQMNGDVAAPRRSTTPTAGRTAGRSNMGCKDSICSSSSNSLDMVDAASTTTLTGPVTHEGSSLTPDELCDLGLETLQVAINHWELALKKIDEIEDEFTDPSTELLEQQLHQLLERAYRIQDQYEQKLFKAMSTNAALGAALQEMDREYEFRKRTNTGSFDESSTDMESFVSALDIADLSDLEDQQETFQHLVFYESALLELKHGSVPCRTLRTNILNCANDTEYLAKLHCVRLAFQELFRVESTCEWFAQSGREVISDLLIKADRDPDDFQVAYDDMLMFVAHTENWPGMEEELRGRGVKVLNFYDIVLDFILLDAFDDLENPPSSVKSVVQNRWLSDGFKETALSTAVWSVLKAKKRMLRVPDGFIAHFYAISEHVSPVMAWGFLGPKGHLHHMCSFFKDLVLGFLQDVFSFDMVRYSNVEQLADDILRLAQDKVKVASAKMTS